MATETVRIQGLEGVMKTLRELPAELVSSRGGPVRSALRKASLIMVNESKRNVEAIVLEPNADGLPSKSTGLLAANIVTTRDRKMTGGERYVVRVRRKAYPAERTGGKGFTTKKVGSLLEYGTERMRAHPWIRPAFDAHKHSVLGIFTDEINKKLDRIVKKLARQNRAD